MKTKYTPKEIWVEGALANNMLRIKEELEDIVYKPESPNDKKIEAENSLMLVERMMIIQSERSYNPDDPWIVALLEAKKELGEV